MAIRTTRWTRTSPWSLLPQDDTFSEGTDLPLPAKLKSRPTTTGPIPEAASRYLQGTSWGQPQNIQEAGRAEGFWTTSQPPQSEHTAREVHQQPADLCNAAPYEAAQDSNASALAWSTTPLLDPATTFRLHSHPDATRVIFLDFDGHTTSGTIWNNSSMGSSFTSPAFDTDGDPTSFSPAELIQIQQIWQQVAADFAPFDVNVTTQAPPLDWLRKTSGSDTAYGIRTVITSYGPYSNAGGASYVDSFTWDSDTPAFVYGKGVITAAETASHEVGHALGLSHDGTSTITYYTGHGTGETGWAPIMGYNYLKSVTTWDDGTYYDSSNSGSPGNYGKGADDLTVITTNNGFGYQTDQIGGSSLNAAPLTVRAGNVGQFGTIETRSDQDVYAFTLLQEGSLDLTFNPYIYRAFVDDDGIWGGNYSTHTGPVSDIDPITNWPDHTSNLDLSVELHDAKGGLVASSNQPSLSTSLSINNLNPGTYYLKLDGVGFGDPQNSTPTGYSDYGSIGNYWISGTISSAMDSPLSPGTDLPTLSIADLTQTEGTSPGASTFQVSVNLSFAVSTTITVDFSTSDGTAISGDDYVAASGTLTLSPGMTRGTINLNVQPDSLAEANESFFVNLFNATGAKLLDPQALVTILNDDNKTNRGKRPAKAMGATTSLTDTITGLSLAAREAHLAQPLQPSPGAWERIAGWTSQQNLTFQEPAASPLKDFGLLTTMLPTHPFDAMNPFMNTESLPWQTTSLMGRPF